jgi:hypothetical protein
VIVKPKAPSQNPNSSNKQQSVANTTQQQTGPQAANKFASNSINKPIRTDINLEKILNEPSSHNRSGGQQQQHNQDGQFYDSSLGVVLNIENLDRDTGEYKYQRRPIFEWMSRWLR